MENINVLVLNNSFVPIYVTNIHKAFNLLWRDKAEVIEIENKAWISYNLKSWEEASYFKVELEKDFKYIKGSGDYVLGIPKVIRLLKYSQTHMKLKLTRKNIFLRDDNVCQYCSKVKTSNELNIDHIIPKAQGGINNWENLVCSCIKCNEHKGARTPKQSGMTLIRQPKRPSMFLLFKNYLKRIDEDPYCEWAKFFPDDVITDMYWNVELK